jgi:hypothetical protein
MEAHHFFIFESLKAGAPGVGPLYRLPYISLLGSSVRRAPFTTDAVTAATYKPKPLSALLLRVRRGILYEALCHSRLFFFVG